MILPSKKNIIEDENFIKEITEHFRTIKVKSFQHAFSIDDFRKMYMATANGLVEKFDTSHPSNAFHKNITEYFYGASTLLDPSKGLFLHGNSGLCKTLSFNIVQRMLKNFYKEYYDFRPIEVVSCLNLAVEIISKNKDLSEVKKYYSRKEFVFDDLAQEETKYNLFGSIVPLMEIIITERERNFNNRGLITHFTCNENIEAVKAKYGSRVFSRINNMCNIVEIKGSKDIRVLK